VAAPNIASIEWLIYAPGSNVLSALGRIDARAHFVDSSDAFRLALTTEQPGVVLLAMPPGTADDVAMLRRERSRRSVTAIVLAGDGAPSGPDARAMALFAGIDDALPLATSGDELLRRYAASRMAARGGLDAGATVPIGDGQEVAVYLHELRRGETVVHLRPREHALLLLLARDRGRVFSRRELLDGAWGSNHDGDPRTVDVHVRWLREKLEDDPSEPRRLLTVRSIGYRLA
jgi:DNA-binding response OmpR family regulator